MDELTEAERSERHELRRDIVRRFSDPGADRWAHFAPDLEWRMTGTTSVSGRSVGRDFSDDDSVPRSEVALRAYVDDVIGEGDRFIKIARSEGVTTDGEPYGNEYATVFDFEGALIVRSVEYLDTSLIERVLSQ